MKVLRDGVTKEGAYKWSTQAKCDNCGADLEVELGDLERHPFYEGKLRFDCGFCGRGQKATGIPQVITDLILEASRRR